jgi:hypothetical protein
VLGRRPEPGGYQQRTNLVAVKADRMRLIVETRPADMDRRRGGHQPLLLGETIKAGNRAKPPSHGGPGAASLLECAGVQLDVCAPDREEPEIVALAKREELP